MAQKRFNFQSRIRSFGHAFAGLWHLIRNEHNAWIHLTALVVVVVAGFIVKLNSQEWALISFAIGLVFVAEILNTAIERMVDLASPGKHKLAKQAKDLAAAAVLFAAITAVIIGILIFGGKLIGAG